jgi:hypothetical protein
MPSLDGLAALAGTWQATYELRGDPSFDSDTPSTATVTPVLGGRFVRIDYTWDETDFLQEAGPQAGSLLTGFEPEPAPGTATVVWIDSWHNGRRIMVCPGVLLDSGGVDVRGTYPGGPGDPDWGWRTVIEPARDGWTMTMFNVTPDGEEALAVSAAYRRVVPA